MALEYIERHRPTLEAELVEIKAWMAQEEAKHRAIQKETQKKARASPMTAERRAFYELLDANKRRREQTSGNATE